MIKQRILITGATGFIGAALTSKLKSTSHSIKVLVRQNIEDNNVDVSICSLSADTNYMSILSDVDVVIHLAGRAHILKETEKDVYQAFAAINIDATERLVQEASKYGVKRFIYMSTTKVCGESSENQPYTERSRVNPMDDYAKTKAAAEKIIQEVCDNSLMDFVIIRPPLVYGPNVKANFKRLIEIGRHYFALPFGAIKNRRSMIYIENLVDFVLQCITHPNAANQIFFVSDDKDLSTTDLIRRLAKYQGKNIYMLPVPKRVLEVLLNCLEPSLYTKLCKSLQVDISKAKKELSWQPPFGVENALRKTVEGL